MAMKVSLNGKEKNLNQTINLKQVIEQFCLQACKQSNRVIAEVNGEIIKSPNWDQRILKDGDKVELVSFVGGG